MNPSSGLNTPFAMLATTVAVSLPTFSFWFSLNPARDGESFAVCLIWTSFPPCGELVIFAHLQVPQGLQPRLDLIQVRAGEGLRDVLELVHGHHLAEDV